MEKLILERDESDYYKLEVNDNGDYIEFDLTDIGLAERIMKASDEILKIDKEYQEAILKNHEDLKEDKVAEARKIIEIENEYFSKMEKQFDSFLGDGACKKIFGEKKKYGQFLQLMNALQPHFDKMIIKTEKAKKKLADKYMPHSKDVI